MNQIVVDPERSLGTIDRNIFGGFAEHLGRCIYGGIYEPSSPHADARGLRTDVLAALRRLHMPLIRYPGGNFVSGYRWMDGIGPRQDRPARMELAWHTIESNHFGTNEFIEFCRELNTEPYLVVNCGDGDMREARDWLEYCNGTQPTSLVRLRHQHGYEAPHNVKYWGIGNEVDGPWQIGMKSATEYARAYTEYAKVMKWTDPSIKLIASGTCIWDGDYAERARLLLEQAGNNIDYMSVHWYVGNQANDFAAYMTLSELFEQRLCAYEDIIRLYSRERRAKEPVAIAVDEWNVWYRTGVEHGLEEVYNLEDALMTGMQMNSFIRHAASVRMANIAQIVNVIGPVLTRPDGLVLQTIFYPFELYSRTCGDTALDVYWSGETFSGGKRTGVRVLDVAASLDTSRKEVALFVVNRTQEQATDAEIRLTSGEFSGPARAYIVNGPDVKAANTFDAPNTVLTHDCTVPAGRSSLRYTFEPHSVTALVCAVS